MDKVVIFIILFGFVYFLESIGGFYMTSAIVYIEKQFQIPSRLAGTMVSAGDFAYIPVVVFTSYFGGKGNRARWIGAGCMLIGVANLLISSSNFVFPVQEHHLENLNVPPALHYQVSSQNNWAGQLLFDQLLENINMSSALDAQQRYSMLPYVRSYEKYKMVCINVQNEIEVCNEVNRVLEEIQQRGAVQVIGVLRQFTRLPMAFCDSQLNTIRKQCAKDKNSLPPFITIFAGLLILGVGRTMPFSLGLPLMDDNVKKQNLPVYFAGMFFVKILGPILGLLIGSVLNKIYVNFEPPEGLSPIDPAWIGCWWLGFLIFGIILFFPSLALYLFPADPPETEDELNDPQKPKRRRLNLIDKHIQKNADGKVFMPGTVREKAQEFVVTIAEVLKSPVYSGSLIGRIVDVLAFKGFFVFLGKYMEIQFGVPQHIVQRYMAISGVAGFAIGVALGATAIRFLKLQGRKAAGWVGVCSLVAACLSFLNAGVGCTSVVGNISQQSMLNNNMFDMCRADCACEEAPLYPVCNRQGDVFYSPCHAGCPLDSLVRKQSDQLLFERCFCANSTDGKVSREFCAVADCDFKFKMYFVNQAIGALFGGMSVVPAMIIILRSVKPEHRSVSLGFNGFVVSLFATLPSPVLWGKLIDLSCVAWQKTCGKFGACLLYDNDQLRVRLHVVYGTLRIISLLSDMWVFYWAKGLVLTDEEEPEAESSDPAESAAMLNGKHDDEEARERKITREAIELMQQIEEG